MDKTQITGLEERFCFHCRTLDELMRQVEHNATTENHGGLAVSVNQLAARIAVNVLQSEEATQLIRDIASGKVATKDKRMIPLESEMYPDVIVIADEAAKPPQPVAAGDVPEWAARIAYALEGFGPAAARMAKGIHEAAEAEISRRVAEAVAAKDKRIDELGAIVADRSDMVKCVSDANSGLARHRDSLRQQLVAAQAEVTNHKEIADVLAKRIDGLRAEVSRLSRPVESLPDYFNIIDAHNAARNERNAREAAEAERDELREAWAMFTVGETVNGSHKAYALAKPSDERNNVALAAFRAEKAKVGA